MPQAPDATDCHGRPGKIAKQALAERKTIREVVIERGHVPGALTEEKLDEVLDVLSMTRPK